MNNEIWKDVPGYEGLYQVSNLGRVASSERIVYKLMYGGEVHGYKRKGRIMKIDDTPGGYLQVQVSIGDKRKRYKIHRLVAMAFTPNPDNKPHINHIDCNPSNNCVDNLEWCTPSENIRHAVNLGRMKQNYPVRRGSENAIAKLNEAQVAIIKKSPLSNAELGRIYGVTKTAIRFIRIGKNWRHVTA
jgi:hypothetical protein